MKKIKSKLLSIVTCLFGIYLLYIVWGMIFLDEGSNIPSDELMGKNKQEVIATLLKYRGQYKNTNNKYIYIHVSDNGQYITRCDISTQQEAAKCSQLKQSNEWITDRRTQFNIIPSILEKASSIKLYFNNDKVIKYEIIESKTT